MQETKYSWDNLMKLFKLNKETILKQEEWLNDIISKDKKGEFDIFILWTIIEWARDLDTSELLINLYYDEYIKQKIPLDFFIEHTNEQFTSYKEALNEYLIGKKNWENVEFKCWDKWLKKITKTDDDVESTLCYTFFVTTMNILIQTRKLFNTN